MKNKSRYILELKDIRYGVGEKEILKGVNLKVKESGINKKELETLMARGLTENEAVDLIVKGLLK